MATTPRLRAIDTLKFAQADHAHRHQRACVSAGHANLGFACTHSLKRGPHGCVTPCAQHLTGFVIHRDHIRCIADFNALRQSTTSIDQTAQLGLGSMQDEM